MQIMTAKPIEQQQRKSDDSGDGEYVVEKILDSRKKGNGIQYLNCEKLIADFEAIAVVIDENDEKISHDSVDEATKVTQKEASGDAAKETAQDAGEEAGEDTTEDAGEEAAEDAKKGVPVIGAFLDQYTLVLNFVDQDQKKSDIVDPSATDAKKSDSKPKKKKSKHKKSKDPESKSRTARRRSTAVAASTTKSLSTWKG
uniref:Uncharacterized protein n=1 Tax=Ditylenchus dipsaci TaxID=166011 RepID=A0A915EAQ3_9BILA